MRARRLWPGRSLAVFECLEGAKALVSVLVGDWIPTSYIRFATDGAYTGYVSLVSSDTTPAIGATHICRVRLGIRAAQGGPSFSTSVSTPLPIRLVSDIAPP